MRHDLQRRLSDFVTRPFCKDGLNTLQRGLFYRLTNLSAPPRHMVIVVLSELALASSNPMKALFCTRFWNKQVV